MMLAHGGQLRRVAERFGVAEPGFVDFSANINPDGPPAGVLEALRARLEDSATLVSYPDLEERALKRGIAAYAGVEPGNVVVANGFVPLLDAVLRAERVRRCCVPVPAFVEYRRALQRAGVEVRALLLREGFGYEAEALTSGREDAVLLANPQNPSGVGHGRGAMLEVVARATARGMRVLLDEAFVDYVPEDSLVGEVERFPGLTVFRSVTKFHGCPGLRVAYAVAAAGRVAAIEAQLAPWPITTLAALGVQAALRDEAYARRTREWNVRRREVLRAELRAMGLASDAAAANFLLLRLPAGMDAGEFWERMVVREGVVVRACEDFEGLAAGHVRVAVRTEAENARLVVAARRTLEALT